MADELTLNASMVFDDGDSVISIDLVDLQVSPTTVRPVRLQQSIGTSEEAINLGDISTPRWCFLKNLDATNYVEIKVATGGAIFAKLLPGEACLLPLGSGATAPYAIANTAACVLDILIAST